MNIGEAARRSGVPAKTIRYYESAGLLTAVGRRDNGYRDYGADDVEVLRFIQRARSLGFSVRDVGGLLALWRDRDRASAEVRTLAVEHVKAIDVKLEELRSVRRTLMALVERCHGDDRPDCPILDSLAGDRDHEGASPPGGKASDA